MTEETKFIVRWDKTGDVWHADVSGVGRYAVRRPAKRRPFSAYLNGELITSVQESSNVEAVKKFVETRITEALRIANDPSKFATYDRRAELVTVCRAAVAEFLRTTRGAHMFGAGAYVVDTSKGGSSTNSGFAVVHGDDNRIYFDAVEM